MRYINFSNNKTQHTHSNKPTIAIGENAMRCISPKNIYKATRFTANVNQALVELENKYLKPIYIKYLVWFTCKCKI